jgi:hypothetical protein
MSAEQAAGTHCALSEFCVGTTTQPGSCDLGLLALWLGLRELPRICHSERLTGKPERGKPPAINHGSTLNNN